jgi:adenylate cyclase
VSAAAASQVAFVLRRLRLITGLVLFTYVTTHFLNHAVGLVSLQALGETREWFLAFWRFPLAALALYASLLTHFLLALWAIYQRRQLLHMPRSEALQMLLGLCIVPLIVDHVVGTRVASLTYDVADSYTYVLLVIWHFDKMEGMRQAITLVVAWSHGCMGLHFWLRLRPWYPQAQPYLYAIAVLIPVLGLLGFVEAGRDVSRMAEDPEWLRNAFAAANLPNSEGIARLYAISGGVYRFFGASLFLTLLARQVRSFVERRRGLVTITYPGGRDVEIVPGPTLLEVSNANGIPHASVCGGRGRCSTCRVRITQGIETLPPPSPGEQSVLARVNAAPNVRLACQIRPSHHISVVPLLPPGADPRDAQPKAAHLQGREKEIAILFADLRGFTQLSEKKLPYDVVFLLNRYFAAMGQAIERAGGHVDKFIGDGVMALFGATESNDPALAARQALIAAREMGIALEALNKTLAHDLEDPLRIGIGIHMGPAIVGEMGYARTVTLTAIGDAVNTASRLETLTKEFAVELVISDDVAQRARFDPSAFPAMDTEIRGRKETLRVRAIAKARDLPEILPAA